MMENSKLVIVGLGLLGSSLAAALKQRNWPGQIVGVSSEASRLRALELGLCDQCFDYAEISQWKSTADLILYCTPIEHIQSSLVQLAQDATPFKPGVIISDVGSTKSEICSLGQQLFKGQALFIGGHPMAGSEKSGIAGVDSYLYESALWILCPPAPGDLSKAALLTDLIQKVGGRMLELEPNHHDALVARISHVPQILSTILAATAGEVPESLEVAGPGFRDMSRLALSNFAMWKSILKTNQKSVHQVLDSLSERLEQVKALFAAPELPMAELEAQFEAGRSARAQLNIPLPQFRQGLCDIIVQIPDEPGQISAVVEVLSAQGLDLRDIELMRVRDGVGGTLRLALKNRTEAEKAIEFLALSSFKSWLKAS